MNRLVFSLLLSTSFLGLQAFAMELGSPPIGMIHQKMPTESEDQPSEKASGHTGTQPQDIESIARKFTPPDKAQPNPDMVTALKMIPVAKLDAVVQAAQSLLSAGNNDVYNYRIIEALGQLDKDQITHVADAAPQFFSEGMSGFDKVSIIRALGKVPGDSIATVKVAAPQLFSNNMSVLQKTDIIDVLGKFPKEQIPDVAADVPKLFSGDMGGFEKASIIQALGKVPGDSVATVTALAPQLFSNNMSVLQKAEIIEKLGKVPKEKIPAVAANVPQLFSGDVGGFDKAEVIQALGKVPDNRIAAVAAGAPQLFSDQTYTYHKVKIIEELGKVPDAQLAAVIANVKEKIDSEPGANMYAIGDYIVKAQEELGKGAASTESDTTLTESDTPATTTASRPAGLPEGWTWQGYLGKNPGLANMFGRAGNKETIDAAGTDAGKNAIKEQILQEHFLKWGKTGGLKYQDEPVSRPQGLPTNWTWQGYLGQNPGLANMFGRAGNKERIDDAGTEAAQNSIKEGILMDHFLKWGQTGGLKY